MIDTKEFKDPKLSDLLIDFIFDGTLAGIIFFIIGVNDVYNNKGYLFIILGSVMVIVGVLNTVNDNIKRVNKKLDALINEANKSKE